MTKRFLAALATLILLPLLAVMDASSAEAASRCWNTGGQYPRCATVLSQSRKLTVVENIPFTNRTSTRQHYTCSFTTTVSRSVTFGGSLTAEAKFKVWGAVDASTSITVHRSVTQTGSQATAAGFDGYVAPGKTVYCQRTYGYLRSRVKIFQEYAGQSDFTQYRTVISPIALGVRVVQG